MKRILKDIEEMDETVYNDIKKTKVSEPVQPISYQTQVSAKLQ